MEEYPTSELSTILEKYYTNGCFSITNITRKNIIDKLNDSGNLEGKMEIVDFIDRVFDIKNKPSQEEVFETFEYDVIRHMRANWD